MSVSRWGKPERRYQWNRLTGDPGSARRRASRSSPSRSGEIGKTPRALTGEEVMERSGTLHDSVSSAGSGPVSTSGSWEITANASSHGTLTGNRSGRTGSLLASFPCVTPCYERKTVPGHLGLFPVYRDHGFSRAEVEEEIRRACRDGGVAGLSRLSHPVQYRRVQSVPNVRVRENGGGT
jgi:hypothetical protein